MAARNLNPGEQQIVRDALQAVAAAEEALQRLRDAGLAGCYCDGPVDTGEFRCRKVTGQNIITCQRCVGNDEWYDTGVKCENGGAECGKCG